MSLQRISSTERISFPEEPDRSDPDRSPHSHRAARLESNGNQDASSDVDARSDDNSQSEPGDDNHDSSDCPKIMETVPADQDELAALLERLKTAHRLDLRF